jgi:hypothetical protein
MASQLPQGIEIASGAYGYVAGSASWAKQHASPRLWTDTLAELVENCRSTNRPVLVLYEEYVRRANPEILSVFDSGMPAMALLKSFAFPRAGRVHIFRLAEDNRHPRGYTP